MGPFAVAVTLAVLTLLYSCFAHAAITEPRRQHNTNNNVRSVMQACYPDVYSRCSSDRSFRCFSERLLDNEEEHGASNLTLRCATWLKMRKVCDQDVNGWGKCTTYIPQAHNAMHYRFNDINRRQCLRQVPKTALSQECLNSEYFKSAVPSNPKATAHRPS